MPSSAEYGSLVSENSRKGAKRRGQTVLLVVACLLSALAFLSPSSPRSYIASWRKGVPVSNYPELTARSESLTGQFEPESQFPSLLTDNGRTDVVQWDNYSLVLNGQRIFLYSGEFHTWRLPVPSLWPDILQKVKAAGLNAISIYTHWGLINPSPGVIDFDEYRALQPVYAAAKEAGLWIVLRPGPYINAETTAGGIAHWVTSQVAGMLRTNASDYTASWQDYIHGIINETTMNQITEGGPVIAVQIDNEYTQYEFTGGAGYFADLEADYHNSTIIVPLTYNDPGQGKNFVNGTGAVDIYGLDSYPQRFDCSNPTVWNPVVTNYYDYHENTNPNQPWYFPEFQGGAFDAWGPTAPGYEACRVLTGADFESVFYQTLWASNGKLMNFYMVYGGTSWGALPFHGVYTSYDYGSAIAENRTLTDKYTELKRQGLFLRSSPEFYKTDWIGNSSTSAVTISNSAAFAVYLRNPDTATGFYIVRQANSSSTATTNFQLDVETSAGSLTIPRTISNITLSGRQSKVIVTNYSFGSSKVLYSTASVLYAGVIGGRDVIFLYGDSTQEHEAAITFTGTSYLKASDARVTLECEDSQETTITFLSGIDGLITVYDSSTQLVLFADAATAGTFWSPVIPGQGGDFPNYWQLGTNTSILVGGPYLVRNATIEGDTLALRGDLETGVRLFVIAPPGLNEITWNGNPVFAELEATSSLSSIGGYIGQLEPQQAVSPIIVPALTNWKYADSLPEIQSDFSDTDWTLANHTTTNIPYPPYYGDGRILYGCDYEYCENVVLWRGHFNATGYEQWVNLSVNGGEAFAASVWVNDYFLNTSYGNSTNNENILEETDDKFYFPPGSLLPGQDNVITIIQDNMGLNETESTPDTSKSPRGVRGFQLDNGNFNEWRVQGKIGGYTNYPDRVRGVFNEGGLYGERLGWHLPGYDTSSWTSRDLAQGLPNATAGVGFFVTTFNLSIPTGYDVPISFNFDNSTEAFRVYFFVNGWMMGKRVANLGPQIKFPVQEGILNYNGTNTIAVALWVMENTTVSPILDLAIDGIYEGGVGNVINNNPPYSPAGRSGSEKIITLNFDSLLLSE